MDLLMIEVAQQVANERRREMFEPSPRRPAKPRRFRRRSRTA